MEHSKKSSTKLLVPQEIIENKILLIKGKKVMLDRDLARLYGVSTKRLNEQVKRNIKRFPEDFMIQLTWDESKSLRSQNAALKRGQHAKYRTCAFTEQGVAMLSSVLNSEMAIIVNIQIMRAFTRLREIILTHKDLQRKIGDMEKKYDQQFQVVFKAIKQLLTPPEKPKGKIGFHP
ncbi:MAG: ORF6N domain-containing protein [Candidatus Omnitrophica bacterium]|nr:ORF6N domain-containing protein [Candidatus Omnitrophota bacterium]MBU1134753.1 ORF6N domain-containing protein [Candidatus Omnitrophota bacterium]MBU1810718.1 ORF6N domain-containing protein [Candidatus Omnitrophota bacterium]